MGVVRDHRPARFAAGAGDDEGIAARLGMAQQQIGQQGQIGVVLETGQGIGGALDQPGPDLGPVLALDQGQQAEPHDPVDVGRAETADGQHVLDRPGLPRQPQHAVFVGRFGHDPLVVFYPVDEALKPIARLGRQCRRAALGPAPVIENAQPVVDLGGQGPGHLGEPAIGDPAHHLHLAQAQMGMDDPQGDGQVTVAFGFDEGHEMVVPANRDRLRDRHIRGRQGGKPLLYAGLFGQRGEQGAAGGERRDQHGGKSAPRFRAAARRASRPAGPGRNLANHRIPPALRFG